MDFGGKLSVKPFTRLSAGMNRNKAKTSKFHCRAPFTQGPVLYRALQLVRVSPREALGRLKYYNLTSLILILGEAITGAGENPELTI